ncbi:MAG: tyrosine recombinase XerD [Bacteroidetes bacterium]|nr:tyrosine recombinase XerD [Bacteroidota bacterium]
MSHNEQYIKPFEIFLRLERSLSDNSNEAYLRDVRRLLEFIELYYPEVKLEETNIDLLRQFIVTLNEIGLAARSQARIVSGIKTFYRFLMLEKVIETNPAQLLEGPKIGRHLPEILSPEEIKLNIDSIDLSNPLGYRNKTIIEVLYGCGLRVSELTGLLKSQIYFSEGYLRIIGKGRKERLVPIGGLALKTLKAYIQDYHHHIDIQKGYEDFIFLNRLGKPLTRVMIFHLVKKSVENAQIKKNVSPHTFRHSFATHLVEGGADLRAVQEMLGHESILTTEIYAHLNTGYLSETIHRFHPRS